MFPLTNVGCTPDEHVKKVDEGEFDEGSEDGHEAHDDEDVQGGGISYLRCKLNYHLFFLAGIFLSQIMNVQ